MGGEKVGVLSQKRLNGGRAGLRQPEVKDQATTHEDFPRRLGSPIGDGSPHGINRRSNRDFEGCSRSHRRRANTVPAPRVEEVFRAIWVRFHRETDGRRTAER
jgi:hypothetical protein